MYLSRTAGQVRFFFIVYFSWGSWESLYFSKILVRLESIKRIADSRESSSIFRHYTSQYSPICLLGGGFFLIIEKHFDIAFNGMNTQTTNFDTYRVTEKI